MDGTGEVVTLPSYCLGVYFECHGSVTRTEIVGIVDGVELVFWGSELELDQGDLFEVCRAFSPNPRETALPRPSA